MRYIVCVLSFFYVLHWFNQGGLDKRKLGLRIFLIILGLQSFSVGAQIALRGWFQRNFTSVAAMFEDRFELWTIDTLRDSEVATPIESQQTTKDDGVTEIRLKPIELPARRSKELRALTGWYPLLCLF